MRYNTICKFIIVSFFRMKYIQNNKKIIGYTKTEDLLYIYDLFCEPQQNFIYHIIS